MMALFFFWPSWQSENILYGKKFFSSGFGLPDNLLGVLKSKYSHPTVIQEKVFNSKIVTMILYYLSCEASILFT